MTDDTKYEKSMAHYSKENRPNIGDLVFCPTAEKGEWDGPMEVIEDNSLCVMVRHPIRGKGSFYFHMVMPYSFEEKKMEIKQHIQGTVRFQFYRDGNLYYRTESGLTFPVPIDDTGNATFLAEDKGILFMRYIRKHLGQNQTGSPDAHD